MGRAGSPGSAPPPPLALFFSLRVREALLPEPLSTGDTRPGAGWGGRPLRSPLRVPRCRPGRGGGASLGCHLGPGRGLGAPSRAGRGEGEGEAVGGLTLLEWGSSPWSLTAPGRPPQVQDWGCTKEALSALEGGGAAVWGGLEKGVRGASQPKRMAGLWWRSHAGLAVGCAGGAGRCLGPLQRTSGHSYPQPAPAHPLLF